MLLVQLYYSGDRQLLVAAVLCCFGFRSAVHCSVLVVRVLWAVAGNLLTVSRILHLQHQASGVTRPALVSQELHGPPYHVHRQLHSDGGTGTQTAPVPKRYVTTRNQLVAGLFLHQVRTQEHINCHGYFSEKLASLCQLAAAGHLFGGARVTM